ncbi:hypothetical protein [Ehrlichia ruminantium]|uniref:hypothetical protein n=1 Tax=Ehrlichia ruminantium TaxID=779 RepID=UPI001FC8B7F5|nr:hypothetical protein [Ehrlichia ruminantium]UOD98257.1 hypothetical protein IMW64_02110 [Ehrlichia ruminantium]
MQRIVKKPKHFNYPKIHLITIVILLAVSDILTIIKLIPHTYEHTKKFIPLCSIALSVSFILLYSIYILYNLNIIKSHLQQKITFSKKSICSHIGFIGESASLLGLNIISIILTITSSNNQKIMILSSILSMLSSIFVIGYATIALSTDLEKHNDLKKTNQSTKYTIWSIGNWITGLAISIINIGVIISGYFIEHKSPEIFKIILLTTYVLIISSMLIMKNSKKNTELLDKNTNTTENYIIKDIQLANSTTPLSVSIKRDL